MRLQVTVLHVYHHASISFIWWMITHTAPGGDAYFSAALNSLVHVLMYTYYLLAILLGKDKRVRAGFASGLACTHAAC
jgi:elongation of very long chain fatty acids protein 4